MDTFMMVMLGMAVLLGGVVGFALGYRRKVDVPELDMSKLMRQIIACNSPLFQDVKDEIRTLHLQLERLTPQAILGEWLHLLERSAPLPEHVEALRVGIAFLQEANRVPTLDSALADEDFPRRLKAVVASFAAIRGVEIPHEDITKTAGLVVLAKQVDDLAETGVKTLSFEERFELLKSTMKAIHATGKCRSQLQYFTRVADALSEACRHSRWSRYDEIDSSHRKKDFETKLSRFLGSGQVPYSWRKSDSMFRSLGSWVVEAHAAGERFRSEAESV